MCSKEELLMTAMRAFVVTQDSRNFYLLDVYANCDGDGDRDEEIQDPYPIQKLKRKEGRRPAILLGLRDGDNDSGVIKVYARKLNVSPNSLTIPVSTTITTEQVIQEAVARFRLGTDRIDTYQLVKVTLEAGRGTFKGWPSFFCSKLSFFCQLRKLCWHWMTFHGRCWSAEATNPCAWWNWPGFTWNSVKTLTGRTWLSSSAICQLIFRKRTTKQLSSITWTKVDQHLTKNFAIFMFFFLPQGASLRASALSITNTVPCLLHSTILTAQFRHTSY